MAPSGKQLLAATAGTAGLLLVAALWTQSRLGASLLPHSFCITASPPLLWLHMVGDGLIAVAYLLIPWAMVNFVRKRPDIPFGWVVWLFCAFIVACGLTHAMHVWTLWEPVYWYSGVLKAFTAAVSLGTAWMIYMLTPQALALPSAGTLREANAALQREIASRREAEAELVRAKAELERLLGQTTAQAQQAAAVLDRFFEVAPVGMVLMDEHQRIVRINPALLSATARPESDYVGRRFDEVPQLPAEAHEALSAVARTRDPRLDVQVRRTAEDGTTHHILASYFPIELPSGSQLMGAVVQDVSAQHRAERQRAEALARAEEANRAKDQFLAKVSHELRSPLQVAMSCSEVLRRMPELPAQARKFVERLSHSVAMQARMINDLLDVSRILSGKLHIENEVLDPLPPLQRMLDHWRGVAQQRGIALETHGLEQRPARVQADAARLEQVYANLLDNAIRFSEDGGRIEVGSYTGRTRWRFFVRDYGAGMQAQEVEQLFEPFAQGSVQPRTGKGLGLGLTIVRSLVEAFGGRVWAESAGPGRGSTFVVELPLAAGDAPMSSSGFGDSHPAPRLDGLRLLYVEDEPEVAQAMQQELRRLGAEVRVAHDSDEALRQLAQPLDALVTDLNLGEGPGGLELVRALRALPGHAGVPAIAVSAFGTTDDVAQTRAAGFADHLVKPVDAATVAHAVRRVLAQLRPG